MLTSQLHIDFTIQLLFVVAAFATLIYMLWGAYDWMVSGGNNDELNKARDRMSAGVTAVVLLVAMMSVIEAINYILGGDLFGLQSPQVVTAQWVEISAAIIASSTMIFFLAATQRHWMATQDKQRKVRYRRIHLKDKKLLEQIESDVDALLQEVL